MELTTRLSALLAGALLLVGSARAIGPSDPVRELQLPPAPQVRLATDVGDILIELAPDRAPITVANFLQYVDNAFYDGAIFHRVINGFIIQTGGYSGDLKPREPGGTVANESVGGLPNRRGAVAMARTSDPNSARAEFFINLKDNNTLDTQGDAPGYTVFGQVVAGMDIAEKIAAGALRERDAKFQHLPIAPVRIVQLRRARAP